MKALAITAGASTSAALLMLFTSGSYVSSQEIRFCLIVWLIPIIFVASVTFLGKKNEN